MTSSQTIDLDVMTASIEHKFLYRLEICHKCDALVYFIETDKFVIWNWMRQNFVGSKPTFIVFVSILLFTEVFFKIVEAPHRLLSTIEYFFCCQCTSAKISWCVCKCRALSSLTIISQKSLSLCKWSTLYTLTLIHF